MLAPSKQKFRKAHKGRVQRKATSGNYIAFGDFGLIALENLRITANQIEAARRAAFRYMKRSGKIFIRIFPDIPVSKKPNEVRMGKGKGSPDFFVARVPIGRVMFEIDGVDEAIACRALDLAAAKLPIKTRIVRRYD